jgi:3-dehydroquinate synthase
LKTLPDEQFYNGLSEIIKEGLSLNRSLFEFLKTNIKELKARDKKILVETISWCNKLKNNIILQDPFEEKGSRQILNFGHTLGHALEAVSQYKLLHGEGVAVGMLYAMLIGLEKKKLQQNNIDEAIVLMRELHLLDKVIPFLDKHRIFDELILIMMNDKKNKQQGICFVLLNGIGDAYTENISDRYFLENIWNQLVLLLLVEK